MQKAQKSILNKANYKLQGARLVKELKLETEELVNTPTKRAKRIIKWSMSTRRSVVVE